MIEPDSGHPTPREDEENPDEEKGHNKEVVRAPSTPTRSCARGFSTTSTPFTSSVPPRLSDFFEGSQNAVEQPNNERPPCDLTPITFNASSASSSLQQGSFHDKKIIPAIEVYLSSVKRVRLLERKAKEQMNESARLAFENEKLELQLFSLQDEMNLTAGQLENRIELLEECQGRIQELNESLQKANIREKEVIAEMTIDLDEQQLKLAEAGKRELTLENRIVHLENEIKELEGNNDRLQNQLDIFKAEASSKEASSMNINNDLQRKLELAELDTQNLQQQLNDANKLNAATLSSLRAEILDLQTRLASSENDKADLQRNFDVISKEKESMAESLAESRKELVDKSIRCNELTCSNSRLSHDVEVAVEHVDQLQNECQSIVEKKNDMACKLAEVERREISLIEDNNELMAERDELTRQIATLTDELQAVGTKCVELDKVKEQLSSLVSSTAVEADKMNVLKEQIELEQAAKEKAQEEESNLRTLLSNSHSQVQLLEKQVAENGSRIEALELELGKAREMNQELDAMKCELVAASIDEKSNNAELRSKIIHLERTIRSCDEQIHSLQQSETELRTRLQQALDQNRELALEANRVTKLEEINRRLASEVDSSRKALSEMPKSRELEDMRVELENNQSWIVKLENQIGTLRGKEEECREAVKKLDSLKYELRTREDHISKLQSELKDAYMDRDAAKKDHAKMESERSQIAHEFNIFSRDVEEEKSRLLGEIDSLRTRLAQLEAIDGYPGQLLSTGSNNIHEKTVWDVVPATVKAQLEALEKESEEVRCLVEALRVHGFENGEPTLSDQHVPTTERERTHSRQCDAASLADSQEGSAVVSLPNYDVLIGQLESCSANSASSQAQMNVRDLVVRLLFSARTSAGEDSIKQHVARFVEDVRQLLAARTNKLEQDLDRLENDLLEEKRIKRRVETELRNQEIELRDMTKQHRELQRELGQKANSVEELRDKLNRTDAELNKVRKCCNDREEQFEAVCRELKNLDSASRQAKEVLLTLSEERNTLEDEVNSLHERLRAADEEVERHARELLKCQSDLSGTNDCLQSEKEKSEVLQKKVNRLKLEARREVETKRYNQETMNMCVSYIERIEAFNKKMIRRNTERQKIIDKLLRDVPPNEKLRDKILGWREADRTEGAEAGDVYKALMQELRDRNTESVDEAKRRLHTNLASMSTNLAEKENHR